MFHHSEGNTLTTPQVQDVLNSYAVNADLNFIMIHYDAANTISTGVSINPKTLTRNKELPKNYFIFSTELC